MFYASYQPFDHWFIDGVAGYGTLNYDNRRFVGFDGSAVSGSRSGSNWFGSVTFGTDVISGAVRISPYVRVEVMAATLRGYAEQGPSPLALTFGDVKFNSTAGVAGLRASYDIATAWGVLSPMARIEYRQGLDGGFNQSMYYTDLGSAVSYTFAQLDTTRRQLSGAIGLRARAGTNLSGELEYGATGGQNSSLIQTLRATMRLSF